MEFTVYSLPYNYNNKKYPSAAACTWSGKEERPPTGYPDSWGCVIIINISAPFLLSLSVLILQWALTNLNHKGPNQYYFLILLSLGSNIVYQCEVLTVEDKTINNSKPITLQNVVQCNISWWLDIKQKSGLWICRQY